MVRRLARFAFTALAALSLMLCVAVCVLWVRSYAANDRVLYQTDEDARGVQRCFVLGSNRGELRFEHHHIAGLGRAYADRMGLHTEHDEPYTPASSARSDGDFALAGFGFSPPVAEHPAPATWWHYAVRVPHSAAALASAAVAAACAWPLYRRSTRTAAGLCVH